MNNAGVSLDGFTTETARATLRTNLEGPLRLTEALLPRLRGGRVVHVSSGMGELSAIPGAALRARIARSDLDVDGVRALAAEFLGAVARGEARTRGWPENAYAVSKVLLDALTRAQARDPGLRGVRVDAACPGWVRTRVGGRSASSSVEEGADTIVWLVARDVDGEEPGGGFWRSRAPAPY